MATGGITFDGTSQYLELGSKIVSTYPLSFVIWLAAPLDGSGTAAAISQGSTTVDAFQFGGFENFNNNKYASDRSALAGSATATRSATPNISSSTYGLLVAVIEATQQTVYYGSNVGTVSTGSPAQVFSDLNRFLIGAWRRAAGVAGFSKMSACEAHVFNTALTSSDVTTLLTTKPETVAGWVDGWALGSASALTSLGGTRTLTAIGSPTTASLTLPYTRTSAPVLSAPTGTATGNTTGVGSVSTTGADGVIWGKRAASAQTDPGGGLEAANGWTSQAVSASGVQNFTFTGLTTNTAVVANYFHVNAGGLRSPVATSAAFTPPTMASSGTLPAQSGTASSAFTYAGATPESQITVQGVGSSSWNLTNAGGSGLGAINGATGVPSGTLTATPGTYTVTVTKIDSSTAGTNPTGGGAPPQTIVRTFSLTVNASGATAVTLSGPSSGTVGSASTAFTVGANGVISGTVTVTPSDAANGGTFTPTSVNISAGAPTATFTYTPASVGAKSITVTNSGSLTNPGALTYTAGGAATAVTLTGPTVGLAGVASTNFTVGANGAITGTVNVTPSAAGCTFSPTSVNISAGTPTATFTCTPAAVGAKSITLTNNGSLTNPGAYTYQANSALATSLSITLTTDGVTPAANLTGLKVAIYNQPTPDLWAGQVPIYTTGNGVTNASGVYTCNITGLTSLVPGAIAGIAISSSDGTLTQGATQKGYVGPVAVS
jgi:hypothetical protein